MDVLIPNYQPSPRQNKFHQSEAFETLFGGAAGGGKTVALCAEAITSALELPNTSVYIFRRTLKELKQSIYPEILRQIAPYQAIPDNLKPITISYNSQDSIFKFSNGSFIQLAYLDTVADRYRYMSSEIHVLLIDELTHFYYDDYEYLRTRVRSGQNRRLRIMCATNPGNRGHGWVKEYFNLPNGIANSEILSDVYNPDGTKSEDKRLFIPAMVEDNPSDTFVKSYKRTLNQIQDENLRRAQLNGDWSVFQGQVFLEWRRNSPVIDYLPSDLDLNDCTRYVGFDWGWRDPACAIWIAVAPPNELKVRHIYVYKEVYRNQTTSEDWAVMLKSEFNRDNVRAIVLPHDCFSSKGGEKTVAQVFQQYDLPIRPANNQTNGARLMRQALLHQLLAVSPDGKPYLQVHRNCENLVRTVPDLTYDAVNGMFTEQIADYQDDHAYDSLTYALMVATESARAQIIDPIMPDRKLKSPIATENGIYYPEMQKIMRSAIKASTKPDVPDWWKYR